MHTLLKSVTLTLLASAGAAFPQQAFSQSTNAAGQGVDAGDIIVTATRRDTTLQSTSESLQVLTGDALSAKGSTDFGSFFLSVPSLAQSDNRGPGNARYSLRGIQSGGEPLVGVYYDETPLLGSPGESLDAGGSQADVRFWDIDRVEVLKGPQGTLFGNGSAGGAIRIITRKPDASGISAAVRGRVGVIEHGDSSASVDGMLNLPLIADQLAFRATGFYEDRGGYVNEVYLGLNDPNRVRRYGGRGSLRWTPTPQTTIDLAGYFQDSKAGAKFELFEGFPPLSAASLIRTPFDDTLYISNLTVEHDFGFASLHYSGSYQERRVSRAIDQTRFVIYNIAGLPRALCPESALADRSCLGLVNGGPAGRVVPLASFGVEKSDAWVHEVRLTSASKGPFLWTIGAFFEDRTARRQGVVAATSNDGFLVPTSSGFANTVFARDNVGERKQISLYGDASYEIVAGLTLTGGARWFDVRRNESQNLIFPLFGMGQAGPQPEQKFKDSDSVFRAKISWEANSDLLIYAIAAQGYRTGGPNQPVGFTVSAPPFESDSLWNYEFGWRARLLDRSLTINGSVFYIDWSNIQFVTTDPTGAFTLIGNGGDVNVKGFELEATLTPFDGLTFSGGVGYNDAKFNGAQPVQAVLENQAQDGSRLPGVPRWSTTFDASYAGPISGTVELRVAADWSYRSGQTTGFIPGVSNFRRLGGYHVVNARTGLSFGNFDLTVEASNLFDTAPKISGRVVPGEPFQYATLQPRTVAFVANVRF